MKRVISDNEQKRRYAAAEKLGEPPRPRGNVSSLAAWRAWKRVA